MMKLSHLFLGHVVFLCVLNRVFSSNPDSEIVQDSSEEIKDDGQKTAPMKISDGHDNDKDDEQKLTALQSDKISGRQKDVVQKSAPMQSAESESRSLGDPYSQPVRVIKPQSQILIIRTVPRSYIRLRNGSILYNTWRYNRNNRPDFVVPTDESPTNVLKGEQTITMGNRPPNNDQGYNANGPGTPGSEYGRRFPYNNGGMPSSGENTAPQGPRNSNIPPEGYNANGPGNPASEYDRRFPYNIGGMRYPGGNTGSQGPRNSNIPPGEQIPNSYKPRPGAYKGNTNLQDERDSGIPSEVQNPYGFKLNTNRFIGNTSPPGERNGYRPPAQQNPNIPNQNGEDRRAFSNTPFNTDSGRDFTLNTNYGHRVGPVTENPQRIAGGSFPGNGPNRRISPDSNFFAGIVNDFAFKLAEAMNSESNFVISPLSIYIALSMCYLGSDGNTKAQMEKALGLNENSIHEEHLHRGISELLSSIAPNSADYQLFVANGMFLGKNFTVSPQFGELIRRYYAAELNNLDFGSPDLSVSVINDWVSRSTRNMIPSLIDRPPPALTRLLLLNAVYFKGVWKTQFPLDLTYNGKFHSLDGSSQDMPFMSLYDEALPFYRSDEHRHSFIKLPYTSDQVSMIIALPYRPNEKPMPAIRDQVLCHVRDAFQNVNHSRVAIPRFKLEEATSLRRPLLQLGVTDIFNARAVDFRKLRRQNDIYVTAILHKAVVEVNEQGTTAAASTGVRFVPLSLRNTTNFVADHPFAFYIVHEPSGLVLFYGKVYDFKGNADIRQSNRNEQVVARPRPTSEIRDDSTVRQNPSKVKLHGAVTYENVN